jgi:predicted DNA-binding transcriptional regulator AlpA
MKSASEGVLMTISRFIPKKEVSRILGVSVSTVIRWSKTGILPQPFELGPNKTMYVRDEIEAYIEKVKETRGFHGRGVDVK